MVRDARYLALACRIAAEMGRHIVKTYYCEGFEKIIGNLPVPVVIAGGKKLPEREALEMTYKGIAKVRPASTWSKHLPERLAGGHDQGRPGIVHEGASVDEAMTSTKTRRRGMVGGFVRRRGRPRRSAQV